MKKLIILVVVLLCAPWAMASENDPINSTGIEPNFSYKSGLNEAINLFNGNLYAAVPLLSLKGRAGFDLNLHLSYNSRLFQFWTDDFGNNCIGLNGVNGYEGRIVDGGWLVNAHPYLYEWYSDDGELGYNLHASITLETGETTEVSTAYAGYPLATTPDGIEMQYDYISKKLTLRSGVWYDFSNYQTGVVRKGDANGNYQEFHLDSANNITQIIDSLGRTVNFYYDLAGYPDYLPAPTRITVLNNNGSTLTYALEYQQKAVEPNLYGYQGYGGVPSYPFMLTAINLPDGTSWIFEYYNGYPDPSGARLKKITYPTGGYTRYEYHQTEKLDWTIYKKIVNANDGQGEITTTYVGSQYGWWSSTWYEPRVYNPDGSMELHINDAAGHARAVYYYPTSSGYPNGYLRFDRTDWEDYTCGDGFYCGSRIRDKFTYNYGTSLNFSNGYWNQTRYSYDYYNPTLVISEEYKSGADPSIPYLQMPFRKRISARSYFMLQIPSSGNPNYNPLPFRIPLVQEQIVSDVDSSNNSTLVSKTHYYYDQFALTDEIG